MSCRVWLKNERFSCRCFPFALCHSMREILGSKNFPSPAPSLWRGETIYQDINDTLDFIMRYTLTVFSQSSNFFSPTSLQKKKIFMSIFYIFVIGKLRWEKYPIPFSWCNVCCLCSECCWLLCHTLCSGARLRDFAGEGEGKCRVWHRKGKHGGEISFGTI